jgi:hypothetical protein
MSAITVISPKAGSVTCPFTISFSYPAPTTYSKAWVDGVPTPPQYGAVFTYTVTKLALGPHILALQAHDAKLNQTVTLNVQITVVAPAPVPVPPPVPPPQPSGGFNLQSHFPKPVLILAHVMPWFGPKSAHTSARCPTYDSADPVTVARQIGQMKALGIGGINIDYYGLHDSSGGVVYDGRACPVLLAECAKQGLSFAVQPDQGIMKNNKSGIPAQTFFESQITEALSVFCSSPAYQRTPDGRFLMGLFGTPAGVNMGTVATKFPQVAFVYEGNGGYGQPGSAGAFAWTPLSGGNSFYTVKPKVGQISIGNLVQGFDDHDPSNPSQSCWGGPARKASYASGQTFKDSIAAAIVAPNPPTWLQLCTWNDCQEGTSFEPETFDNGTVTLTPGGAVFGGKVILS